MPQRLGFLFFLGQEKNSQNPATKSANHEPPLMCTVMIRGLKCPWAHSAKVAGQSTSDTVEAKVKRRRRVDASLYRWRSSDQVHVVFKTVSRTYHARRPAPFP